MSATEIARNRIIELEQQLAEVKDALSDYYFPGLPLAYSVAELAKEYKQRNEAAGTYLDQINEMESQLAEREKQNVLLREYLEQLACLGNGTRHGNSVGNVLAIDALAAIDKELLT